MKQARLARWLCPLLLLGLVVGARAADDDEWDPAGDHKKIKPTPPASSQPTDPSIADALKAAANSPGLQSFGTKLAEVNALALQGEYATALQKSRQYGSEVAEVRVTAEFVKPRTTLAAAFMVLTGQMEALTDQGMLASRSFGGVSLLQVGDEVKAMALEAEACVAMLDYDFSRASGLERRARQRHQPSIQPAFDGASMLFSGRPDAALESLKPLLGKGQNNGLTALFAAASALALNRGSEAAAYLSRPETAATAIWPQYYLVAGLLDAAGGSAAVARAKFEEGARREQGRVKANAALAAVAQMAAGEVQPGAMALAQVAQSVPNGFRPAVIDLLANPSQAAAQHALATPKYWLTLGGYQPGELLAIKSADLPPTPEAPAPDVTIEPGAETPATDTPAPPTTDAPAASSAPATSAPAATAAAELPADPGVASINPSTQAAKAYRSAVELIGEHKYAEAEAALDYSIGQEALPEALLARGQLRYLRGEYRGAAADYAMAAKLRPDYAEAIYSLAQATEKLGDSRKAAQLYGVALGLGLPPALEEYARSRAGGM